MKITTKDKKYCDVCNILMNKTNDTQNGSLKIGRDRLDFQGCPVANADVSFDDVCDTCLNATIEAINKVAEKRKKIARAHKGDPCIYCNIPHDDVAVGPCTGKDVYTDG